MREIIHARTQSAEQDCPKFPFGALSFFVQLSQPASPPIADEE